MAGSARLRRIGRPTPGPPPRKPLTGQWPRTTSEHPPGTARQSREGDKTPDLPSQTLWPPIMRRGSPAGAPPACYPGSSRLVARSVALALCPDQAGAMSLFRKSPPRRPVLQRRVPRPWDPPETEFPAVVPISPLRFGRSEQTAIAITGISAYSNGFEFAVTRLIRPDLPGWDQDPGPGAPRVMFVDRQGFQISLRLSDGRVLTTGNPPGDAEPAGPILRSRGGGGTSHYTLSRWWAWPLPPSGPLEFICQLGTDETRIGLDARLILDAAQRSIRVWPENEQ
jgi:hypothetical protein